MGGVVELDNFSMNIPEGAFDSDFELKLFEKDANEWDNDNVSKIIGMPVFSCIYIQSFKEKSRSSFSMANRLLISRERLL